MILRRVTLLLIIALAPFFALSQDSTKVRFYIKGSSEFHIKIDNELLPLKNTQKITPGMHDIEIWSPMHKVFRGTIDVPARDSIAYFKELKKDPAYVDYLFKEDEYKQKILVGRTLPLFGAFVGAAMTPFTHVLRKRWHEEMVISDFNQQYIGTGQSGNENIARRYGAINSAYFVGIGMFVGGIATHLALRNWVKELEKPVYQQENPFTLELFEIGYSPINQRPTVGATITF